ncbi:MAG: nuclear transport factor 2 family protein [Pseudomonadota bacterium]
MSQRCGDGTLRPYFSRSAYPHCSPAQDTYPEPPLVKSIARAIQRIPTEIEIAVDRKDRSKARSFFADTVTVDFSTLSGQPPATIPSDALIAAWSANLGPKKESHHQRGHGLVTVDGDTATIYSQGHAWNKMEGNGDPLWEV